jgi:hypothetical protein
MLLLHVKEKICVLDYYLFYALYLPPIINLLYELICKEIAFAADC